MRSLLLFLTTAHSESNPPVDKTAIDVIHTAEDKSLHGAASHLVTSQKHELDEAKSLLFDAIEAFGKVKDALSLSAGELVDCSVIGHLGISKIKEAEKAIHHPKNPPGVVEAEKYLKEAMKKHDQLNTLAAEIHKSYTALRADITRLKRRLKRRRSFWKKV